MEFLLLGLIIICVVYFFINKGNNTYRNYNPIQEAEEASLRIKRRNADWHEEIVECGICGKTAKRSNFTRDGDSNYPTCDSCFNEQFFNIDKDSSG